MVIIDRGRRRRSGRRNKSGDSNSRVIQRSNLVEDSNVIHQAFLISPLRMFYWCIDFVQYAHIYCNLLIFAQIAVFVFIHV